MAKNQTAQKNKRVRNQSEQENKELRDDQGRAIKKKALLIDISLPQKTTDDEMQDKKYELESLVKTYGDFEIETTWIKKSETDKKLFLRQGILDDLIIYCRENEVTMLILGNILKPRQIWDLTELLREEDIEVWDRVDLILNIFSQHAQSSEAKLQIQLAKIRHMGPRIFGMGGNELSRQSNTRGKGETNTEIMKRHLRQEEKNIEKKLEKVRKTKCLHRQKRKRSQKETVALVGYTNAGKSRTMNALTKKGVDVKDALFQTLDTRLGLMFLPKSFREIFIADTIGFIANLPPNLIAAFQSTLSESINADVLLHVVDVSDDRFEEKIEVVDDILEKLGISDKKQFLLFNKIDNIAEKTEEEIVENNINFEDFLKSINFNNITLTRDSSDEDRKNVKKIKKLKNIFNKKYLLKKYESRTPVFISADKKMNLDDIRDTLEIIIPQNHNFNTYSCTNE
ncbi:TPA: GTPase HflX [Candidatus Gracilibacteria bacterium]|nr:GTPase HflX [Candidatus Gracilibacteria bacterium]HIQ57604.1 GTPase HflX [Candidatus Gracilibacteria bacterium]